MSKQLAVIRLEPVLKALPAGFDALRAEARAEGYRFVERLAADWASGELRFDRLGEVLLAAYTGNELAAIGGLTLDPVLPETLRMRRFYVRERYRRFGIGRRLATALCSNVPHSPAARRPSTPAQAARCSGKRSALSQTSAPATRICSRRIRPRIEIRL
jgi:GNAT superfamily N-acetyltransferase